jgi:hypothetical protein
MIHNKSYYMDDLIRRLQSNDPTLRSIYIDSIVDEDRKLFESIKHNTMLQ